MNNAFEKARAAYGTGAYDDATLEFLFPQLKESEEERNERMRKRVIESLVCYRGKVYDEGDKVVASMVDEEIIWMRKQKENPKSADSIPSDCVSDVKCEDRWHKVVDSLPDNGWDVLAKDALGNYLLASFDGAQWFVSVYDGEDHPVLHTPPILEWCEIPSDDQKEQKPAEWSEEDEKMLKRAIHIIVEYSDIDEKESEVIQNWLKSLRPQPHWKPTKAMLDALNWAKSEFHPDCLDTMKNLTYLYKELQQLYYDGN